MQFNKSLNIIAFYNWQSLTGVRQKYAQTLKPVLYKCWFTEENICNKLNEFKASNQLLIGWNHLATLAEKDKL